MDLREKEEINVYTDGHNVSNHKLTRRVKS